MAEAEIRELHRYDHWIIVINLQIIDIGRADPGRGPELINIHSPAAAQLHRILGKGVVSFDRRQNAGSSKATSLGDFRRGHDKRLGSGAGHDAIVKMDGVSDRPGREIGLQR